MAYFAKGAVLWKLRRAHPDRPSRESVAQAIGVSTKAVYEWEKHNGGIKWPNVKAAAAYYGVEPDSISVREDEEGDPDIALQVFNGARAEQLDRIEKKVDELKKLVERLSPPGEGQDDRDQGGGPIDPQSPLGPPPTPPDQVADLSDEEGQRRKA